MTLKSIQNIIIKLGGSFEMNGPTLIGVLNEYDITFHDGDYFFTSRPIKDRGYCDLGSDYNTGGFTFHDKVKHMHRLTEMDWQAYRSRQAKRKQGAA